METSALTLHPPANMFSRYSQEGPVPELCCGHSTAEICLWFLENTGKPSRPSRPPPTLHIPHGVSLADLIHTGYWGGLNCSRLSHTLTGYGTGHCATRQTPLCQGKPGAKACPARSVSACPLVPHPVRCWSGTEGWRQKLKHKQN